MTLPRRFLVLLFVVASAAGACLVGRAPAAEPPTTGCISPEQMAAVDGAIRAYEVEHPERAQADGAPIPLRFYPLAANLDRDALVNNFVDLDPGGGLRDWGCYERTYNGHNGHDINPGIDVCDRMNIGVPIFAALDGTVVDAHDGEEDRSGCEYPLEGTPPANYVVLGHGGTQYTLYWHFKKGSVRVQAGDNVRAGTELGLMGSSGWSTGPHLHFGCKFDGAIYEPFAGDCRSGASSWVVQPPISLEPHISEARVMVSSAYRGAAEVGTRTVGLKWRMGSLPPSSIFRFRYYRPDGSLAVDAGDAAAGNDTLDGDSGWIYRYQVDLDQAGTWQVELSINGTVMVSAPLEVVSVGTTIENQPPSPVTAEFDPPRPDGSDAIFCRVMEPLLIRDPDSNLVSYRFQWSIDGLPVRDTTNASMADAIPAGAYAPGQQLVCKITPTDGALFGQTTIVSYPAAPIGAPTELKATARSASEIALAWKDNSDNETAFEIQRKRTGDFARAALAEANATGYTDQGLASNTTYTYRVRATNDDSDSGWSNESSATTILAAPAPPSSFKATGLSSRRILLTWRDNSANEERFELERKPSGGAFVPAAAPPADATRFEDGELTPDTTFTYRLRAVNAAGSSAWTDESSATTTPRAPAAPQLLSAIAGAGRKITVTWSDRSDNETGFEIDRQEADGAFLLRASPPADATSYPDFGLRPGTRYTYRIRAVNEDGASASSSPLSATSLTVPGPPMSLAAAAAGPRQVDLTWRDASSNETGFTLERKTGAGEFSALEQLAANQQGYADTTVSPNTTYGYRLRAFNAEGTSDPSAETAATTPGIPVTPPSGLTARALSGREIALSWSDTSDNETAFEIERKTTGKFALVLTVGAGVTGTTDRDLEPETTYRYRVRARAADGVSGYSNQAQARTQRAAPGTPQSVRAKAQSGLRIRVTWKPGSGRASSFRIVRQEGGGAFREIASLPGKTTLYLDRRLKAGKSYGYRVRAVNPIGSSGFSATATATARR
jgi:fibronectin type 3 domain-containing protein